LIQSIKFPDPASGPERSKAAWPLQVFLYQIREDASLLEKPEMGNEQVSEIGFVSAIVSSNLLRLSKKLTYSVISFLIFVFTNPPKSTYN
jgi:hypothetical protein